MSGKRSARTRGVASGAALRAPGKAAASTGAGEKKKGRISGYTLFCTEFYHGLSDFDKADLKLRGGWMKAAAAEWRAKTDAEKGEFKARADAQSA